MIFRNGPWRCSNHSTASMMGSGLRTIPGPPPKGRSSTVRCRSRVKSRKSTASTSMSPFACALPKMLALAYAWTRSGKRVRKVKSTESPHEIGAERIDARGLWVKILGASCRGNLQLKGSCGRRGWATGRERVGGGRIGAVEGGRKSAGFADTSGAGPSLKGGWVGVVGPVRGGGRGQVGAKAGVQGVGLGPRAVGCGFV